jgi:16S rRNA (cytosine1402-N4)-methyltransferase
MGWIGHLSVMSEDNISTAHVPVLLEEVLQGLRPQRGGRYLDCTVGGGGHAEALLRASAPDGLVLGSDADPEAIARARARLPDDRLILRQAWLDETPDLARALGFAPLDGILIDLGVSSDQLAAPERGFSFMREGPLDMRFDRSQGVPAWLLIERMDIQSMTEILRAYGDVPNARQVAEAIWRARPITTTSRLREVVSSVARSRSARIHPATQVFQALRIAVNDELRRLRQALPALIDLLRPGARIAVIAFHSAEDRIVKEVFRRAARAEVVSPGFGMCEAQPARLRVLTKTPIRPSASEIAHNPRARSARLRIAERQEATKA